MFLLDTNFIIHLTKGDPASIAFVRHHSYSDVFSCSIVNAELYYGAFKSKKTAAVLDLLRKVNIFRSFDFDQECAYYYGQIRSELQENGKTIGPNDLLIASIALKHDLTLVTRNIREFSLVPNLKVLSY